MVMKKKYNKQLSNITEKIAEAGAIDTDSS